MQIFCTNKKYYTFKKNKKMEITIEIDTKRQEAQKFIELLKVLSFLTIKETNEPNKDTIEAIEEARNNRTTKVEIKTNDIFEDILNS